MIINLCVPTASGVPLQLLPKEINGVRIIGIDVPGFGVPTHAEAKDVLAGAMLQYAMSEASPAQCRHPAKAWPQLPTVTLLGEMFPADPMVIAQMLAPMGLAVGPRGCPPASGASSMPRSTVRSWVPIHPSTPPACGSSSSAAAPS